jgi:hypothetical protein
LHDIANYIQLAQNYNQPALAAKDPKALNDSGAVND